MTLPVEIVVFHGSWPVPSASPPCLKLMTWLRMAGIPYEDSAPRGRPQSKTGKAPYLVREDGTLLDDSSLIIDALTAERTVTLDAARSPRERALMLMVQRTVESHLYFGGLLHRWLDHWPTTRQAYFSGIIPRPLFGIVTRMIRKKTLAQAHGQGLGRRPRAEVTAEMLSDLTALEEVLGENDYFFGSPGVTDAIVYGTLENVRSVPLPGEVRDAILSNPRWTAYLDRIKARYWA